MKQSRLANPPDRINAEPAMKNMARQTYESEVVKSIVCDICKREFPKDWSDDKFDRLGPMSQITDGRSFPDDCYGDIFTFDICPECFKNKLIPWLKSQGAEPTVTKY